MEEKEGKRIVGVHHLGAEKSGATRLSQARPEARLWLRDHLGRQAWNAERWEEWGEGQIEGKTIGRQERERERKREWVRERQKKAPKGLVETKVDVRASSSSVELWIGESHRMALSKKRERERGGGNQRRGPCMLHSSGTRVFKYGYPRECRSTTDRTTRIHVRSYELQDLLFPSPRYSRSSLFRLHNLFGTIPSHNVLLPP